MAFVPGSVVALKSGGQPMTVVATCKESVKCIWVGEEGDLFSATIPAVALEEWDSISEGAEGAEDDGDEDNDCQAADVDATATERRENAA